MDLTGYRGTVVAAPHTAGTCNGSSPEVASVWARSLCHQSTHTADSAGAGLALDIHVIPHVGFGAHAEYASIGTGDGKSPEWLAFGLHLEIDFGRPDKPDDRR